MLKYLIFLFITLFQSLFSLEHLPEKYLICYGNPSAHIKVTEYFSFTCPHCIALFRKDFRKIREDYLDTDQIYWVFHPVPLELITAEAMACLSQLSPKEKRIFLEAILQELDIQDPAITPKMMKRAMELFNKPLPHLEEEEFLSQTPVLEEAFQFIGQDGIVEALPSVSINGMLYEAEIPDYYFIQQNLKKHQIRGALQ